MKSSHIYIFHYISVCSSLVAGKGGVPGVPGVKDPAEFRKGVRAVLKEVSDECIGQFFNRSVVLICKGIGIRGNELPFKRTAGSGHLEPPRLVFKVGGLQLFSPHLFKPKSGVFKLARPSCISFDLDILLIATIVSVIFSLMKSQTG